MIFSRFLSHPYSMRPANTAYSRNNPFSSFLRTDQGIVVGLDERRIKLNGSGVIGESTVKIILLFSGKPTIVISPRLSGIDFQSLVVVCDSPVKIALVC